MPYLLGDFGNLCLSWLMVPHQECHGLPITDALYNRNHRRGRSIVENSFTILKQTFQELLHKTKLAVSFVPDVSMTCALLHNMLLRQSSEDVQCLLNLLRTEGFEENTDDEIEVPPAVP